MTTQAPILAPSISVRRNTTRRSRRLPLPALVAAAVLVVVGGMTLLAPVIAPYGPLEGDLAQRLQPLGSAGHLLGTDGQGRDVATRLLYGARPSLLAGLLPVVFAGTVGTVLGLLAALGHPHVHTVVMRALDVLYAFPAVLLAIAIAAALGSGISNAIIALAIILVPPVARVTESEAMRVKNADFMAAAQVSGATRVSIALRQVLPNVAPGVIVYATALVGLSLVYAAGLSYLGLGVSPPTAEWGVMVSEMQQYLFTAPLLLLVPAVAILVVSVAFNVLGDGLRDFFNVRTDAS